MQVSSVEEGDHSESVGIGVVEVIQVQGLLNGEVRDLTGSQGGGIADVHSQTVDHHVTLAGGVEQLVIGAVGHDVAVGHAQGRPAGSRLVPALNLHATGVASHHMHRSLAQGVVHVRAASLEGGALHRVDGHLAALDGVHSLVAVQVASDNQVHVVLQHIGLQLVGIAAGGALARAVQGLVQGEDDPGDGRAVGHRSLQSSLKEGDLRGSGGQIVLRTDGDPVGIAVVERIPEVAVRAQRGGRGHLVTISEGRPVVESLVVAGSYHPGHGGGDGLVLDAQQVPHMLELQERIS